MTAHPNHPPHPHHPPHPQFLDVDWPRNHSEIPAQPLQLENEFDLDPSRYDLLQGDLRPPHPSSDHRRRHHPDPAFMLPATFNGQPLAAAANVDYTFTFPPPHAHPQSFPDVYPGPDAAHQHQHQHQQQFYPDTPYPTVSAPQSMPSSPFYPDELSYTAFAHAHTPAGPLGHVRTNSNNSNNSNSNPHPNLTPTMRSFQGSDVGHPPPPPPPGVYANLASPIHLNFGASPGYGMSVQQQPGLSYGGAEQQQQQQQNMGAPHAPKRLRALEDGDGEGSSAEGDGMEPEGAGSALTKREGGGKAPKPLGACARCKGLKVKCEFKTDPDICKRCLNGGHECVIPGRKKRRAPPRRDLLLNQIREQASKIEELMKQLEIANKRAARAGASGVSPPPDTFSNTDKDTSTMSASELTTSEFDPTEALGEQITKPDVLDWIAKARESIMAFGDYINMGGPTVTQDMVGEDVLGWKDSSDSFDEFSGEDDDGEREGSVRSGKSDFHVEVEDVDAMREQQEQLEQEQGLQQGQEQQEPLRGRMRPGEVAAVQAQARDELETGSSATRSSHRRRGSGLTREKLAILPNEAAPIGMLAKLSLKKSRSSRSRKSSRSRSVSSVDSNEYGVANEDYFRASSPGPNRPNVYAQHQTPYILRSGLVTPVEVEKLFKIYFDYMNPSLSLLDPVLYTAQNTFWRSPFLFTVICGIASRFYSERQDLYSQAMKCARLAAGSTLIGGQKSVECVQAYILLSLYPVPTRKWEEDRCWVYLGLAMRIATDLNLHLPATAEPQNEHHAREMLNRTRTWLNCFSVDRQMASQYGKAPIVSNTDYVANHTALWYTQSSYNLHGFDIHLCAYIAELKILADYRHTIFSDPDHPVGLNSEIDITVEATKTDDQLARLWETWIARIREEDCRTPAAEYRTSIMKLAYSYARMTVLSFAFQHTHARETSQGFDDAFFWRCLRAAKDLIRTLLDEMAVPHLRIYLRHGPDSQCVFITFTCAFLIKLLHPRFVNAIPRETRVEIRGLVEDVANFLGTPEVAIDERHGPMMYSRFLHGLLDTAFAHVDYSPVAIKRAQKTHSHSHSRSQSHHPSPPPRDAGAGDGHHSSPSQGQGQGLATALEVPGAAAESQGQGHDAALALEAAAHEAQLYDGIDYDDMQPAGSELFATPLPFDNDLLHSMQSLTDTHWSNMVLPGFNWIDTMQQDNDVQMKYQPDLSVSNAHY